MASEEQDSGTSSEPERKFSQKHYDRLTRGQEPWLEWRSVHRDGTWEEFSEARSGKRARAAST